MTALALELESDGYETVYVDDMGDGCLILSQHNEISGRMESVVVNFGRLQQAMASLHVRYGM